MRRLLFLGLLALIFGAGLAGSTARPALADSVDPMASHPNYQLLDTSNWGGGPSCAAYGNDMPVIGSLNPLNEICKDSFQWVPRAKVVAFELLTGILFIEIFFIAVRQGLFKSDMSELVGSVAFKVFVACIMIGLISNADTIFQGISRGFEGVGQDLSGVGTAPVPFEVAGSYALAAVGLIALVGTAHTSDADSTGVNPIDNLPIIDGGTYLATGSTAASSHLHDIDMQMIFFLAAILLGCAAIILLQYILITAESYIVIFGGIIMLGFAGTKYTLPFAQGYMSYVINNGARLIAFYLVIGIEQATLGSTIAKTIIAAGAGVAASFGPSIFLADAAVILVAVLVLQVSVMTSLVWFIPNLAGSFLGGNTSMSADSMMKNMQSSTSQMSGGMKNLAAAFHKHNGKSSHGAPLQQTTSTGAAPTPNVGGAPVETAMAPTQQTPLQQPAAQALPGSPSPQTGAPATGQGKTTLSSSAIALSLPNLPGAPASTPAMSAGRGDSPTPTPTTTQASAQNGAASGGNASEPDGAAPAHAPASSPVLGGADQPGRMSGNGEQGGEQSNDGADGEGSTGRGRRKPKIGGATLSSAPAGNQRPSGIPGQNSAVDEAQAILASSSFQSGTMDLSSIRPATREKMKQLLQTSIQKADHKARSEMDEAGEDLSRMLSGMATTRPVGGTNQELFKFSDPSEGGGP